MLLAPHEERSQHGSNDAGCGNQQRQDNQVVVEGEGLARLAAGEDNGHGGPRKGDGGNDGADVGLEQVGAHSGHVAHVVAHVIGDYGGISRVVLGDARFNFADQVRAHVGGLGVDAAADPREEGDGGRAEAEARNVGDVLEDEIQDCNAKDAQADNSHAHNCAGIEGDPQGGIQPRLRRGGGARVGADCNAHAQESGQRGGEAARQI